MAIQFQCPKCFAAIRVPDSAAGKQGTCPTCQTRLLVPMPEIPPVAPATLPGPAETSSEPSAPFDSSQTAEASAGGPALPWDAPAAVPKTNIGRALKKRRKRQSRAATVLIPLLFGAALLGTFVVISMKTTPKMEGELQAAALPEDGPEPFAIVAPDEADVPAETVKSVLEHLESQPEPLISERMRVEFRGDKSGLRVSVSPASRMEMVVVDPRSHPLALKFAVDYADRLDAPRMTELTPAIRQFFISFAAAAKGGAPLADLPAYRDKLGLAALTKGLGHCTEALVGTTPYRCVYESAEGQLYFIVPAQTSEFVLHGRALPDGTTLFPGRFVVQVNRPAPKPAKKEPPVAEGS